MRRKAVAIYMRVADNPELRVGTARSIAEVPVLLRAVADRLESGLAPDEPAAPDTEEPTE